MNLIDKAKQNKNVKAFLDEISSHRVVNFKEISGDIWDVHVDATSVEVSYGKAKAPHCALAHELLHAYLQINGYQRYKTANSNGDDIYALSSILDMLDNELQHFRMYPKYESMKLAKIRFYCDSDKDTLKNIEDEITQGLHVYDIATLFQKYMPLLATGGYGKQSDIERLKAEFKSKIDISYGRKLDNIENHLQSWYSSNGYDPKDTIRDILVELGCFRRSCFGVSEDEIKNGNGIFVDKDYYMNEQ